MGYLTLRNVCEKDCVRVLRCMWLGKGIVN